MPGSHDHSAPLFEELFSDAVGDTTRWVTPRLAARLHAAARAVTDRTSDAVSEATHYGVPLSETSLTELLPRGLVAVMSVRHAAAVSQGAAALARQLEAGETPCPASLAEEVALEAAVRISPHHPAPAELPSCGRRDDPVWARTLALEDYDVLMLFDDELVGRLAETAWVSDPDWSRPHAHLAEVRRGAEARAARA